MRVLKWIGLALAVAVVVVLLLDTLGGRFLDGPIGPIPGGAFEGPVNPDPDPDWSRIEDVIELEIRPEEPWSLSVWGVVVDGDLYVPSGYGARRRWPSVALRDPRVRVRTGGQIYERRLEKLDVGPLRTRVIAALAEKYDFEEPPPDDDSTWVFRVAPRQ